MKVLCIGDSNTYGFDPRSYIDARYPEEVRWTSRLEKIKGISVINFGINGMTIPGDHSIFTDLIRRKDPDQVVVMLGTNDILEGAGALIVSKRMESFLASLRTMKKPILLIAPPALQEGESVPDEETIGESKKIGELYREAAERNACRFADAARWGIELTFDGVHFSASGHDTFAKKLAELL